MPVPLQGIVAALWTPTDAEGRLLHQGLQANLEFLRAKGIEALMVLGSTGEFIHLPPETRKELLRAVRASCLSQAILANISDVRPSVVAELGQFAKAVGCDAVAALPPWFYPLAQEDLAEFFARAGRAAALPLFLYNFPERTGNRIQLETIAAVAEQVHLAGVKQSGAEFDYHVELVRLASARGFVVFTGNEARLVEAMRLGVKGCVSGLANAIPEIVLRIHGATVAGQPEQAQQATEQVVELMNLADVLEFPLNVAAAMEARGLTVGHPKAAVSLATAQKYRRVVAQLQRLYQEWALS